MKELILCILLLGSMAIAFYLTRNKKDNICKSCHKDCNQCNAFTQIYEDYRKDYPKER